MWTKISHRANNVELDINEMEKKVKRIPFKYFSPITTDFVCRHYFYVHSMQSFTLLREKVSEKISNYEPLYIEIRKHSEFIFLNLIALLL